jgi:predicted metalloprotease with PDZ domain
MMTLPAGAPGFAFETWVCRLIVPDSAPTSSRKHKRRHGAKNLSIPQRILRALSSSKFLVAFFFTLFVAAVPARATIRYEIAIAHPAQHQFHVTMTIPDVRQSVVVQMPAWNALYQIRNFAYRVTALRAVDSAGKPLPISRSDKQTWTIQGKGDIRVEYSDYWDEPGPFGTQLNNEHAFLNLAMVLCYIPDRRAEESIVHFTDVPQNWRTAIELSEDAAATYHAPSYDSLVDAPVEIGPLDLFQFQAAGRPIRVAVHGDSLDHARITDMLTRIVEYESRLMGGPPFSEYLFIYHVGRDFGGGGMEHSNSTTISVSNAGQLPNVSAHEFFHLWNVKRIRPQSLEPVDYTREMFSPSLWFAEGFTNTYAAYTLVRSGVWNQGQFLADLTEQIDELAARPARHWESAEESSLNAWFEKYGLYNEPSFSVSYYNKGQLLGVGLDILIRDATDNRASLDDVMRKLNHDYAQMGRYYPDTAGIRAAAQEVVREAAPNSQLDIVDFFQRYVAGTDDLPLADWLSRAGLTLKVTGDRRIPGSEESAQTYSLEENAHPNEKQLRIRDGLLKGTVDQAPQAKPAAAGAR